VDFRVHSNLSANLSSPGYTLVALTEYHSHSLTLTIAATPLQGRGREFEPPPAYHHFVSAFHVFAVDCTASPQNEAMTSAHARPHPLADWGLWRSARIWVWRLLDHDGGVLGVRAE